MYCVNGNALKRRLNWSQTPVVRGVKINMISICGMVFLNSAVSILQPVYASTEQLSHKRRNLFVSTLALAELKHKDHLAAIKALDTIEKRVLTLRLHARE